MNQILRARGGAQERVVDVEDIHVPDLWKVVHNHEAQLSAAQKKEILECWHLCWDLLFAVRDMPNPSVSVRGSGVSSSSEKDTKTSAASGSSSAAATAAKKKK